MESQLYRCDRLSCQLSWIYWHQLIAWICRSSIPCEHGSFGARSFYTLLKGAAYRTIMIPHITLVITIFSWLICFLRRLSILEEPFLVHLVSGWHKRSDLSMRYQIFGTLIFDHYYHPPDLIITISWSTSQTSPSHTRDKTRLYNYLDGKENLNDNFTIAYSEGETGTGVYDTPRTHHESESRRIGLGVQASACRYRAGKASFAGFYLVSRHGYAREDPTEVFRTSYREKRPPSEGTAKSNRDETRFGQGCSTFLWGKKATQHQQTNSRMNDGMIWALYTHSTRFS